MTIEVNINDGPLLTAESWRPPEAGAVVMFDGVVRPMEEGRALTALAYEDYAPMTHREMERLAWEVAVQHGLAGLRADHSRGVVRAGECSFRLWVAAPHRKAALSAMDEFIDRMKREVPLWKVPVWE